MADKKYLDGAGLSRTWEKIKSYIAQQLQSKLSYVTFLGAGSIAVASNHNLIGPISVDENSTLEVKYAGAPVAGNTLKINESSRIFFSKNATNSSKILFENGMIKIEIDKYLVAVTPVSFYTGSLQIGIYNLDNTGTIEFQTKYAAIKEVRVVAICNSVKTYKVTNYSTNISFGSTYAKYPVLIMSYVSKGTNISDSN